MPSARGPLPEEEFHRIYSRVPRLTVEVVIADAGRVLLTAGFLVRHVLGRPA